MINVKALWIEFGSFFEKSCYANKFDFDHMMIDVLLLFGVVYVALSANLLPEEKIFNDGIDNIAT